MTESPDDLSGLRTLMGQTAVAQLEVQRALGDMSVEDLSRLRAQLEDERADAEAAIRLLTKALALKASRGDGD